MPDVPLVVIVVEVVESLVVEVFEVFEVAESLVVTVLEVVGSLVVTVFDVVGLVIRDVEEVVTIVVEEVVMIGICEFTGVVTCRLQVAVITYCEPFHPVQFQDNSSCCRPFTLTIGNIVITSLYACL